MPTKYQPQIDTALRSITAKGRAISIRRTTSSIDPVTQEDTITYADHVAVGVLLPVGNTNKEASTGTDTARNHKYLKMLVAAGNLAVTPEAGDSLLIGADLWEVLSADSLAPDGAPIIFTLILVQ